MHYRINSLAQNERLRSDQEIHGIADQCGWVCGYIYGLGVLVTRWRRRQRFGHSPDGRMPHAALKLDSILHTCIAERVGDFALTQ